MGYLPDGIKAYFGDGGDLGLKVTYVTEERLGTAERSRMWRSMWAMATSWCSMATSSPTWTWAA